MAATAPRGNPIVPTECTTRLTFSGEAPARKKPMPGIRFNIINLLLPVFRNEYNAPSIQQIDNTSIAVSSMTVVEVPIAARSLIALVWRLKFGYIDSAVVVSKR